MRVKINRADGGISIMEVVEGDALEAVNKWISVHPGEYLSHDEITIEDLPQDRVFREAWGHDCKVRMDKAREIHMSRIREARDKKLSKLDIEQLKGNDVAAQKQALRDLPQTFDLTQATTPEELKALWPDNL